MSRDTNPPLGPDEEAALRRRVATGRPFSALYRDMARLIATLDAERDRPLDRGRLARAVDTLDDVAETNRIWRAMGSTRLADAIADAYEKERPA